MSAAVGRTASILILLGSARSDGDTAEAAQQLRDHLAPGPATLVDLGSKTILPFDYKAERRHDDLDEVADLMIAHRSLVFATPVYWYAMSGVMKTFFDRFSDLLSGRDPLRRGRALAGRDVWLLAAGTDPALPERFEVPFARTAHYLGMNWRGGFYVRTGKHPDRRQLYMLSDALQAPTASAGAEKG